MPEENKQQSEETPAIRQMREHIENLERQLQEKDAEATKASQLERQLAFTKAGIDIDSKAGSYFAKAYEGELDIEAIKAEAMEVGLIEKPAEQPSPEEQRSTREREELQSGASDEQRTDDPRKRALDAGFSVMEKGASSEDAIGEAFAELAWAAYKENDDRVIYRGPRE